jgi:hypothetical protein
MLVLLFVIDGSRQPTSGSGWRILGYQRGFGGTSSVVPMRDFGVLATTFDHMLLPPPPANALDGGAVFWFTATGSFGCPSHLAGIDVDRDAHLVSAVFTRALTSGCDVHAVPDSFIVSIDPARLPAGPYRVVVRNPAAPPTDQGIEVAG